MAIKLQVFYSCSGLASGGICRKNFLDNIYDFMFNAAVPWSQGGLIKSLNRRLHGWAAYHRITEAGRAFTYVDAAMNAFLRFFNRQA